MAFCFEKVAFELGQYRPKARERQLTCTICFESLPLGDFPADAITSTCLLEFHRIEDESFVCKSCINESIDAQLSVSRPDEVSCPSCKQKMSHQDIQKWTEQEVFDKYDRMITLQAIQEDGSFIRCWRPECGGGQFHDGEAEFPIVICQECGAMTCYRHSGLPWHEGLTCDEFENPDTAIRMLQDLINDLKFDSRVMGASSSRSQAQMTDGNTELESKLNVARRLRSERQAFLVSESDQLGAKAVAETTKPCPQCHAPVEKTGGCKHIKCRCGFEFCYGCLVGWNLAHLATPCSEEHDHADVLNLARRQAALDPAHALALAGLDREARMFGPHRTTEYRFGEAPGARPGVPEATNQPPRLLRHGIAGFEPRAPGPGLQPPFAQPRVPADRPQHPIDLAMQRHLDPQIQRAPHGIANGLGTRGLMDFLPPPPRQAPDLLDRHRFRQTVHEALLDPILLHRAAHTQHLLRPPYPDLVPHLFHHWARGEQNEITRDMNLRVLGRQYVEQGHVMRLSIGGIMQWADEDFAMRLQILHDFDARIVRAGLERFHAQVTRDRHLRRDSH